MNEIISPKYHLKLSKEVSEALRKEYTDFIVIKSYIKKWHEEGDFGWENFKFHSDDFGYFDLNRTLNEMPGYILIKIAVDMGVDTPDLIPSIAFFKNEIKSSYLTSRATFERAFLNLETHPDLAIGLANSALESIIKEIIKDDRLNFIRFENKTLYGLTTEILKQFYLFSKCRYAK
jgi:hypothetical protein